MTYGTTVMFIVAAVLIVAGATLYLRLRGHPSERQRYAFLMAATMLTAAGIMLFAYAFAMYSWSKGA